MTGPEVVNADQEAVELKGNAVLGIPKSAFDSIQENPDGSLEIVEKEKKDEKLEDKEAKTQDKDEKQKDKEGKEDKKGDKQEKEKSAEKDKTEKSDEAEPSGKTDEPEKATEKDTEKGKESEESEQETQEGQPKSDAEATDDPDKIFQDKVNEKVQNLANVYKTAEDRNKFLKDLDDHPKFFARNTQKAMEIADERKELNAHVDRIGNTKFVEAFEAFEKSSNRKEVLEVLDELYEAEGDHSKNLVRNIFDLLSKGVPEAQSYSKEQDRLIAEGSKLAVEREIVGLGLMKDSPFDYSKEDEINKTIKFADDYCSETGNFINLNTAHRLRSVDVMSDKINSQQKKIESLKQELKDRNEEVKKLKSQKIIEPVETETSGKSAKRETYKEQAKDDRELMSRMSKDFDALMTE